MSDMRAWMDRQNGRPSAPAPQPQPWFGPQPQYTGYPQPGYQQPGYPPQFQQPYPQQYPQYPQQPYPQYQQPQGLAPMPQQFVGQQPYANQAPTVPLLANGRVDVNAAKAMYGDNFQSVVARAWQGGEATRSENETCPNCHEGILFSMKNSPSVINTNTGVTAYTAPTCSNCNYRPGRTMQGDVGNWATAA